MSRRGASGRIYFIQGSLSRLIKIGWAVYPNDRLRSLQTRSAEGLELLAHMPGTLDDEAFQHRRCAAHRVRGEWFSPEGEVLAALSEALEHDQSSPEKPKAETFDPMDDPFIADFFARILPKMIRACFGEGPAARREFCRVAGVTPETYSNIINSRHVLRGVTLLRLIAGHSHFADLFCVYREAAKRARLEGITPHQAVTKMLQEAA